MKSVKAVFTAIIICLLYQNVLPQNSRWLNYTDMKNITGIVSIPGTSDIYCSSLGGLFLVDAASGTIKKEFNNISGLINNELTALTLDNQNKLWIGASDGSISIYNLADGSFKYIFDIRNSTESNKRINGFLNIGNMMYTATGYGIHKISVTSYSFIDAPYKQLGIIQSRVNALTSYNGFLFAATDAGIAYASITSPNLNDPSQWQNFLQSPADENVKTIETFANKVIAGGTEGAVVFDGSGWMAYPNPTAAAGNVKHLRAISDNLYMAIGNAVYRVNSSDLATLNQVEINANYTYISSDNNGTPVYGTSDQGVYLSRNGTYSFYFPNGPYRNGFEDIVFDENGILWAAGGASDAGFYRFDGSTWENFNTISHPEIGASNFFRRMAVSGSRIWAMSFGSGITLIEGSSIVNYNPTNSSLPGISASDPFCTPFGGATDQLGRFWIGFYASGIGKSLYVHLDQNNFLGFNNPGIIGSPSFESVAIDGYNTKWVVSGEVSPRGLYYFNENGTLQNPNDDVFGFYTLNDFDVDDITDVIVDNNNEVWISTNNGVFIISNPLQAITNPSNKPAPVKMRIISGNLAVPFTENCRTITTDILNQKWIGTDANGVFHLSEDGTTLIEQFNRTNSPILDNRINSIAVNNADGRAYFGTLKGLSSVSTDAVEPAAEFEEIIMSPNPFLLPSSVDLKISGLVENTTIKVMTLEGKVIDEFESPGGKIATWNNSRSKDLATGIYIIVAYNEDGTKVGTGKFAVVRR